MIEGLLLVDHQRLLLDSAYGTGVIWPVDKYSRNLKEETWFFHCEGYLTAKPHGLSVPHRHLPEENK